VSRSASALAPSATRSRSSPGLASAAAALEQRRQSSTLLLGGLGVAGVALGARYALKAFAPAEPEGGAAKDGAAKDGKEAAAPVSHKAFGAEYWARRMYTGGFEGSMSRREAALILGIRESADAKKVQERHKKMLISNHPDHGGSAFIASKINEAKDVFLKGERSKS
jgi:DnaJ family protein C protein 19